MARLALATLMPLVVLLVLPLVPAGAEHPSDIVPELADDGVFIAAARSDEADPGMFLPAIEEARAGGVSMAVVWPDDPQPNTGAFARRVQEASMVDVVLVFGPDDEFGSFVSEDYQDDSIRAAAAAREVDEPSAKASAFVGGLLEVPVRERPAIVNDLVRWIILLLAALVVGAVGEQMIRSFKKSRKLKQPETETETVSKS